MIIHRLPLESRKKPAENKQTAKAVCYLSRYSYSTVYVKYAPFLGDKFLFVYPEGSISAKNICSCDRPVLRLKTIYLAVLYIFRTNQSLLNEGL